MQINTYSKSNDFSSGVGESQFHLEIVDSSISTALDGVTVDGDDVMISFESSLSDTEKSTLDDVVNNHDGSKNPSEFFVSTVALTPSEVAVPDSEVWEVVRGTVTAPELLVEDLSNTFGFLTGEISVSGGTVDLNVEEKQQDGTTQFIRSSNFSVSDNGGTFEIFKFATDVTPSQGRNTYCLQAKVPSGVSLSVRFVTISLFENIYN